MKKLFILLIVLMMGALVVLGCGVPATTPATPATSAPATKPVTTAPTTTAPAIPSTTAPVATTKPATPTATATKPAPATPRYGGILRVIEASGPGTPIGWPAEIAGGASTTAQICMDFLLHEELDGTMTPHLATSYDVNPDPKNPSITFKIRKGVKFHDGTNFNAQAVKWNFEQSKTGTANISTTGVWKSFDLLDDYTLRVNMTYWQNRQLRSFGAVSTILCSPSAYEKNGVEWTRWHMVGNGAFKQTEFQKDVTLKTVRYDDYWEPGKPYLEGVQLLYVADELTRLALFKTGGAEVLGVAGNYRVASELKTAGYQILTRAGGANFLCPDSMNADSPWSNIKVRMAAEYAIDKEAMTKAFGYGFQQAAYQVAPPGNIAFIPNVAERKYDPEKAKQLLKEAGYPSGFKTKIIAASGGSRDVPVALQSYLNAVGIQVDLDFAEAAKFQSLQNGGTWSNACLLTSVINYANYNAVLAQWFGVPSSWFKSMKKPDGYEDMFKASVNSAKPEPALLQKCVRAFYDEETVIPLVYGTSLWATTSKVHDSGYGTRGSDTSSNLQNCWLSK